MDQPITTTSLCATCADNFSHIPAQLLEPSDLKTRHWFSYTTDLTTLQRDGACAWCTELAAMAHDYENPAKLADTPLAICMGILSYWKNDPVSRHTLVLDIRLDDITYARRSYELFHYTTLPPNQTTSITRLFDQSTTLLTTCSTHPYCHPGPSPLPTRVLDVHPDPKTGTVRLRETPGLHEPYAALSYIWGGPQPLLTTLDTHHTHLQHGFDERVAPATIRDAIQTTRNLGLRYLWVDALCIIQDDEADKNREIAQMCGIYKRAWVTIVAADARSVHEGFLQGLRPLDCELRFRVSPDEDGTGGSGGDRLKGMFFLRRRVEATTVVAGPIHTRAWTLGERLLSPRILVFGADSLRWQCRGESAIVYGEVYDGATSGYECLPTSVVCETMQREPAAALSEAWVAWSEVVVDYGERGLTHAHDKLIALGSVAEVFGRVFGGRYLAGLWECKLVQQLLWVNLRPRRRRSEYTAPSWSWASVDGQIGIGASEESVSVRDFEVLDCQVELAVEGALFGAVNGGYIRVRGVVRTARLDVEECTLIPDGEQGAVIGRVSLDVVIDPQSKENGYYLQVWCLQIEWESGPGPSGLLLVPVRDGVFRRVGKFSAPHHKDWFVGGDMQEIMIE